MYDDYGQNMGTKRIQRAGQDQLRPKGSPPPCWKCPKTTGLPPEAQAPLEGRKAELSLKNIRAFRLYQRVRATSGMCLTSEMLSDEMLMKNLGIIDSIVRAHEVAIMIESTLLSGGSAAGKPQTTARRT